MHTAGNNFPTHTFSAKSLLKHGSILHKLVKDGDKAFEALVVLKTLVLTILGNLHSYQGHADTNKTYSAIKRDNSCSFTSESSMAFILKRAFSSFFLAEAS